MLTSSTRSRGNSAALGSVAASGVYIDPPARRQGLGRALLAAVEAHGRAVGASHVWLETSNVNVPGVAAYERLGYALCGADTLYYGEYMPDETAIYLAKRL
jgi:ribosomal protein S18 acetylase RimI-like enzyme